MRKEADIICLIDLQDFAEDQPLKILAHDWKILIDQLNYVHFICL